MGRFTEIERGESSRTIVEQYHIQQIELELQNEELRRIQAELEASRARYFDLFDLAPVGYVRLDREGAIVQSNLMAATLFGTTKSALNGRLFSGWIVRGNAAGSDTDLYFSAHKKLLETLEPQVCEVRLRRRSEPSFWARLEMSLSHTAVSEGIAPVCRIVIIDITDRKVAEQCFNAFMSHSPLGAAIIDEQGRYLDVNPAMMEHTGRSKDAWVGRRISEVWPAVIRDRLKRRHAQVLSSGQSVSCIETLPHGNQSRIAEVIHFPFQGPKGKKLVGCITFDVTERVRLENALREANSQLAAEKQAAEESTRAKSGFLSAMSHEIRTPLNGVIGMAGLMLGTPMTAEQTGHMRVIVDSSELLLRLVDDILDLSKIEAGKLDLEDSTFNLENLIEDTLYLASFKANEKRLELAAWYPPEVPRHFSGDPIRLTQVLTNLISNAVKFTEAGHVLVEVDSEMAAGGKCLVSIFVRDTGIGVAKEKQSFLFDAFRQADATIFNRFGGTGLGLSIVKQIVELMGGTVSVRSVEGQGAAFRCDIPLATKNEAADWPPSSLPVSALQGVTVLICGKPQIRKTVMAKWCERWGMKVQTTELVTSIQESAAIELVIIDGQPESFPEALVSLRSSFAGAALPKVVLVSSGHMERAEAVDAVLLKPVRIQLLFQTLSELLGPRKEMVVQMSPSPASQVSGCRVLVTDDNLINQKLAAALLSKMGCQVDVADSGLSAVEKVTANEYDLVFMDCVMPLMDGFEATVAIRKLAGKLRRVPIVALTASATTQDRDKCLAVGMDDFLTKPIRKEQLVDCLAKWTGKAAG